MMKKYDKATKDSMLQIYMKKVDAAYFTTSDVLEQLMGKVEEMFTQSFENGNRKIAITKLRASEKEREYYGDTFSGGTLLGASIPLMVFALYEAISRMDDGSLPEGKYMLQIYGGFFMMVLMGFFFALNCMAWTKYKVNYKFIFEFNTRDALDYRQFMLMTSIFMFLLCIIGYLSFRDFWTTEFNGRNWAWIYLGIGLFIFMLPLDIFFLNSRIWLMSTLQRLVMSGLYPVEFKDFFMGDIVCSLTYSISNLSMFFCLYATHWDGCLDGSSSTKCGSSKSRVLGFLSTLPSIWRLVQCIRRYADTGDWFPHLANMGKYSVSTLYYMALSLYRIEMVNKNRALLITFATLNSIYSSFWDLFMDWSLMQFDSENFLLRDELIVKNHHWRFNNLLKLVSLLL
ncbi:unnamed protein product [Ambrosiozyma monospora]|uniref:Unnamed protein product n=1 Tax=Ambrosiozyma monospora TaxID=43982 RepID=A0ACB5U859_AMBMO|nr:unnamed protein product [Ambrosiozyma monospora]